MREAVGSSPSVSTTSEQAAYRLLRLFSKVRACSFRCSSFSAKGRVRVACSLAGALTTALAHYQPFAGTRGGCIFFVVPYHVGAKSALLRLIFCKNKPSARSLAPPFSQKVTLGSPVRLQAPSQLFAVATNFLRAAGASLYQPKPSPIGKLQKNRGKAKGLPSKSFLSHRAIGAAL